LWAKGKKIKETKGKNGRLGKRRGRQKKRNGSKKGGLAQLP